MRKLVMSEYVSLDGVFEEPGQWSFPFWSDEAAKFKFDELFAGDALLLGRLTYEGFAAAWPTMTDEAGFADRMNSIPKYVVTSTLRELTWNNSHRIEGNIAEAVSHLKQQPGMDILLAGSGQLVRELMRHDLIDEYRFMVHPIILGSGKRLFDEGDGVPNKTLQLVSTQPFASGIVVQTYRRPEPAAE